MNREDAGGMLFCVTMHILTKACMAGRIVIV